MYVKAPFIYLCTSATESRAMISICTTPCPEFLRTASFAARLPVRVILNKQPSMSNLVFNWVLDCVRNKLAILLDIAADSAVSGGAASAKIPADLPVTAGVLYLGNNQML